MCLFFAVRRVGANTRVAPAVVLGYNKHFPVLEMQFSPLGLTLYGLDVALMRMRKAEG